MPKSVWVCQNPECGTVFQWDPVTQIANYSIVFSDCPEYPDGAEMPMQVEVSGDTKPCGCPQCGCREIKPLEGKNK